MRQLTQKRTHGSRATYKTLQKQEPLRHVVAIGADTRFAASTGFGARKPGRQAENTEIFQRREKALPMSIRS
jgi:hypothetical protein